MSTKKPLTPKQIIVLTLILNLIVFGMFFIILLLNASEQKVFPYGGPVKIFGYFLTSSRVLPKHMSVIVLLSGVIIEITNYIVLFYDERIKNNFPKLKLGIPCKILNIAAIISLPVWFSLLTFYQFNLRLFGGELFNYDLDFRNATNETFIFMTFLILASVIVLLTLVINLKCLGLKISYIVVLPAVLVCFILNLLAPPVVDVLYYGSNFKEKLIIDHQEAIHRATHAEYADNESSAYTTNLDEVYYDEIIDSMEIYPGYIVIDFKFTDSRTGETLWVTMRGMRLWFGKYQWSVDGAISDYWADSSHPIQKA